MRATTQASHRVWCGLCGAPGAVVAIECTLFLDPTIPYLAPFPLLPCPVLERGEGLGRAVSPKGLRVCHWLRLRGSLGWLLIPASFPDC